MVVVLGEVGGYMNGVGKYERVGYTIRKMEESIPLQMGEPDGGVPDVSF